MMNETNLDLRMIRSHAISDETEWRRQLFIHVYPGIVNLLQESCCSVEAGRTGANDGDMQRPWRLWSNFRSGSMPGNGLATQ